MIFTLAQKKLTTLSKPIFLTIFYGFFNLQQFSHNFIKTRIARAPQAVTMTLQTAVIKIMAEILTAAMRRALTAVEVERGIVAVRIYIIITGSAHQHAFILLLDQIILYVITSKQ